MKHAVVSLTAFVLISLLSCQGLQGPEGDGPSMIGKHHSEVLELPEAADGGGPVVIVTSNIFFPFIVSGTPSPPPLIYDCEYGTDVEICFVPAPGQDCSGLTWKAGGQEGIFDGDKICIPPPPYILDSYSLSFEVSDADGNVTSWGVRVNQVPREVESTLDIQPNRCPNALNPQSRGLVRMALLGRSDFDVRNVHTEGLWISGLENIKPVRFRFEDVGSPATSADAHDCPNGNRDGLDDLVLWFRVEDLAHPLPPSMRRFATTNVNLFLFGLIEDDYRDRRFIASDCVQVGAKSP